MEGCVLHCDVFGGALESAGLGWGEVLSGSHPDDGSECAYILADVTEWGRLLVALAAHPPTAGPAALMAGSVMMQQDGGLTRFWLPGVRFRRS